jgi:putative SOS response-associated peptidase YedK
MCGRFTLFEADKILSREFGVSGIPLLSPRYNIAPSQPVAAVRAAPAGTGREFALLRWGLIPSWSKDPAIGNRLINARAETVQEKPSFRTPFRRHRCLIPVPPDEMLAFPVSPRVNAPSTDDEGCIAPLP